MGSHAMSIFAAMWSSAKMGWQAASKTKEAELASHWFKPYADFQTSPSEFYKAVQHEISLREIPRVKYSYVKWRERGLLSANRLYLRVEWRRYVCDICAAPYGTGFFFSSWLVILPPALTLLHFTGMALTALISYFFLYQELGIIRGAAILVFSITYIWWLLRTGRIQTQEEIEELLLGMTIIGPVWDRFFRSLTYFEVDTASMFNSALHSSVIDVVDKVTQAKGLEPIGEEERKPVMRDFFRRKAYA